MEGGPEAYAVSSSGATRVRADVSLDLPRPEARAWRSGSRLRLLPAAHTLTRGAYAAMATARCLPPHSLVPRASGAAPASKGEA